MKQGNWVPIDKRVVYYLPKDRPYSKVEALISLQVTYDCNQKASLLRFSKLWSWSMGRVGRFLKEVGLEIEYKGNKFARKNGKLTETLRKADGNLSFLCNKGKQGATETKRKPNGNQTETDIKTKTNTKTKDKNIYGHFKNVLLTEKEFLKLEEKFNSSLHERIEKLSEYMASKGKRYKSHYATILAWSRKDNGPQEIHDQPIDLEKQAQYQAHLEKVKKAGRGTQ